MPENSGRTGRSFRCVQGLLNGQRTAYSLLAAVSSAVMTQKAAESTTEAKQMRARSKPIPFDSASAAA